MSLVNVTSGLSAVALCAGVDCAALLGTDRERGNQASHANSEQRDAGHEAPAEMLSNRHFTHSLASQL